MPRRDEYDDDPTPDDDSRDRLSRRDDDLEPPPKRRSRMSPGLIIGLVGLCLLVCGTPICIGLLLPAVQNVRGAANRMKSSNNLKQMALAAHNYESVNDELPGNIYSPDGKPLLSWRIQLLPYLEQDNLYRQFKLDEPWDSPNNIRLLTQMPKVYQNPNEAPGSSKTYYRGFSNPGAIFAKRPSGPKDPFKKEQPFGLSSLKDLPGETILFIEAGDPVEWTKPDDLDASPGKPFPSLGGMKLQRNRIQVALVDGSVIMIRNDLPESTLRALVTHSGGEPLPPDWKD